jgi:hypothetical protein
MYNLILVDVGFGSREKTVLHRMNVITGDYLTPFSMSGTFIEQMERLLQVILKDKPDKIIFDKNGTGLAFHSIFMHEVGYLKHRESSQYRESFSVDEFGLITYY